MISLIVCSVNPGMLEKLQLNIAATIGVPFDILAFDNRKEKKSLAEVYNDLAAKAVSEILCFVHEDVVIHTKGWGKVIEKLLANVETGLVGIAGAVYKSKYAGSWSACDPTFYRTHSMVHYKNLPEPLVTNINPDNVCQADVAVLDGVFMATRKNVFKHFSFDATLLRGFHGYDIDYSMQVRQKYKLVVTYDILLEHLSSGMLNNNWLHDNLLVHNKWANILPTECGKTSLEIKRISDYQSCYCVLGIALRYKGNKMLVLKYFSYLIFKYFDLNKLSYSKTVVNYFFRH